MTPEGEARRLDPSPKGGKGSKVAVCANFTADTPASAQCETTSAATSRTNAIDSAVLRAQASPHGAASRVPVIRLPIAKSPRAAEPGR